MKFGMIGVLIIAGVMMFMFGGPNKQYLDGSDCDCQVMKRVYYDTGEIKNETAYKDGRIVGLERSYFKSKNIKSEIFNENGVRNGIFTSYYETGEQRMVQTYQEGVRVGDIFWFFKSGAKKKEYIFFDSPYRYKVENTYNESGKQIKSKKTKF